MGCLGGKTDEERLDEKSKRDANKKIERQLQKERQAYKATHRLLLLGQTPVCLPPVRLRPAPRSHLPRSLACPVQVRASRGKAPSSSR